MMSSILIVTIVAPVLFARTRSARQGLNRLLVFMLMFFAAYFAYVTVIHVEHVPKPWGWNTSSWRPPSTPVPTLRTKSETRRPFPRPFGGVWVRRVRWAGSP